MVHSCTALTAIVCDLVILSILSIQPAKQVLPEHTDTAEHTGIRDIKEVLALGTV